MGLFKSSYVPAIGRIDIECCFVGNRVGNGIGHGGIFVWELGFGEYGG